MLAAATTPELVKQQHANKRKKKKQKTKQLIFILIWLFLPQELNEYKHDILTMEQTTISEIHSYQRPPACVHDVMAATYMLLGHPEHRLTVSHVSYDSFCDVIVI